MESQSSIAIPTPQQQAEALNGLNQLGGFLNRLQSIPAMVTFTSQVLQSLHEIEKRRAEAQSVLDMAHRKAAATREQAERELQSARDQAAQIVGTATEQATAIVAEAQAEHDRLRRAINEQVEAEIVAKSRAAAAQAEFQRLQAQLEEAYRELARARS